MWKNENMCTGAKSEAYSAVCLLFLRSACPKLKFFVRRSLFSPFFLHGHLVN